MHSKVLIVGTSPYDKQGPARAFESYFNNWEKENLIQIFTSPIMPKAGHCSKLYQVTDSQMLKSWFSKKNKTGVIYKYEDLSNINEPTEINKNDISNSLVSKLYSIGKKKTALTYLLRGILWRKKYWCTPEINDFVDQFKPECIFLAFSDDYFILQIALYFAERYDIPIISCIGDDYYFINNSKYSPLNYIYKKTYRKLVRSVFKHGGSAAYIGNKIRDKYNSEFNLNGKTVYLSSEIIPHEFKKINSINPKILYCGNIRLGRNHSLNEIGKALAQINQKYCLDVYSNEKEEVYYKELVDNPNINYHGAIPYKQVMEKMSESDILVVVEGFDSKDVDITRYSLSTKVADSLATGGSILAFGSKDTGAMDYIRSISCTAICTNTENLVNCIKNLITDESLQKRNYDAAMKVVEENHRIENSTRIFESVIEDAISKYKRRA